jgi:diketogulonate reductase-like aldo/keto reductase
MRVMLNSELVVKNGLSNGSFIKSPSFSTNVEYKTVGKLKIPTMGLGTWLIGGGTEPDYSKDNESVEAIKNAIELGYNHIDTAAMYGDGHCEELVGEAIKNFDRKKLFITTKVHRKNLRHDDLIADCKKSLKRLGTDFIDLYLIHAPNPKVPLEETMKAMDFLVEKKLVRFIGVSNFTVDFLKEAQKFSKNKIVANQIEYSLLTRNFGKYANNKNMESKTVPYCQENDIIIMAERPIERGLLTQPHSVLDKLASKYNKTRGQIAINWLISKKNIITIPKSTNIEHLKENLGAMGWNLSEGDIKLLDETNFESPNN